jgi:hypothetical protein
MRCDANNFQNNKNNKMNYSLFFRTDASVICLILSWPASSWYCSESLFAIGFSRQTSRNQEAGKFTVRCLIWFMGFILAFTFSNSAARFDNVRNIMVDEANITRNTILRAKTSLTALATAFVQI